ncbi:hypothetical protein SAY87_015944 [Trapa incisa]|uniref:DRBM domain-containing protein n=1 Tax=Trapa incisa TaxID=236973 RepID=A0AAN7QYJ9_9MYRT|nr:hypothetical protein SAY87_015944 [Trapa incisa]
MANQFPQPQLSQPPALPKDHHAYKNRLQEFAQKSAIPIPKYTTVNEGLGHLPRFRATVFVDGNSYTSTNTFLHRKEAEQDVAKIAYEALLQKVDNEEYPLVHEDLIFCKSIMNEFATKMHLEKPTYKTCQTQGDVLLFKSCLSCNGVAYATCIGKNKKEAEQLAARAAIKSLLGNAESEAILAPILKSKAKVYVTLHGKCPTSVLNNTLHLAETADGETSIKNEKETLPDDNLITFVPPHDEFSALPAEPEKPSPPITFVPAEYVQHDSTGSSKRKRKNKKKVHKRSRTKRTVRSGLHPFNKAALFSVSLSH